ncbi:acetyl-CoA synthetase-like protein [Xylariaceae sp. FL1651]|nr:acetyl-CoA synthetase-like protein [Xylariaceae sp. FL1651]
MAVLESPGARQPLLLGGCLVDSLRSSSEAALRYSSLKKPISYRMLHGFVQDFAIPVLNSRSLKKPVVAIVLPNGPLLAATIIAVANSYIAAPINPAAGPDQVRADIALAGASAIISCNSEAIALQLHETKLDVFFVTEDHAAGIRLDDEANIKLASDLQRPTPNMPDDIAMILFTSGTSGNRKVVPFTVGAIQHGVSLVIDTWNLTSKDICLNMMPLYHIGGIIRNLFAPMFSGGSTICCPSFDPNLFWDQVEDVQPTWYYASPTMHSMILEEAKNRTVALQKSKIRLVCNAAGSLLPALAERIRDTFGCIVLPSYGMTECMPISTPPMSYCLDRPGTSGIITGPELAIMDTSDNEVSVLVPGRICLRGSPLFKGYLQPDGSLDKSAFNPQGWFDTGDIGYMDADGYLYITGRNKEVINRGGELISPFEVENAIITAAARQESPTFGRISQALAFSARHETLQEVVGVVLVTPPGKPRVDLRCLYESLRSSLQQVKWPVVIVYMNDVPKRNNKVLRVRLGERLGISCLDDYTPYSHRHRLAQCPPPETDLSVAIPSEPCLLAPDAAYQQVNQFLPPGLEIYMEMQPESGTLMAYMAPRTNGYEAPEQENIESIKNGLYESVDGYMVPHSITPISKPFPRNQEGKVDMNLLSKIIKEMQFSTTTTLAGSTALTLTRMFADVLQLQVRDIAPQKHFFALGGDSLRAGKLLSMIRSEFEVRVPIDYMFKSGSVDDLCEYIDDEISKRGASGLKEESHSPLEPQKTYSSTNPLLLLLQLVPITILYPIRRAFSWTFFIYALVYSQNLPTSATVVGRLVDVVLSIAVARVASRIVLPWVGILAKWLIVGRFKEGLYPMWGLYHTRWWITQKIVMIFGKGVFGMTEASTIWYYRLLGAKIGSGVTIKSSQLGEWDLLDIRDNATLDGCIVRPMAGERNTMMYLGKITIGRDASVGLGSTVAPGTTIPDSACIGPRSSSWELRDANEANRDLSATKAPKAHWALSLFCTLPLRSVATFVYHLPWLLGLIGLVLPKAEQMRSALITILNWFAQGERVAWYYLARSLRSFFGPFFIFAFAILVRKLLTVAFGKLRPSRSNERGQIDQWRMTLMKSLMPNGLLYELTNMFGQHYEATSVAIRLLGGKVGRRVYWPGTGPSIGDYELIDIGNDVVFGSRSHLVNSDGIGSDTITIGDGVMIADRVVALPAVTVGERATLGSGCLTKRGMTYEPRGVYVGSKGGDSVFLGAGQQYGQGKEGSSRASRIPADDMNLRRDQMLKHTDQIRVSVSEKQISSSTASVFTQCAKDLEMGHSNVSITSINSEKSEVQSIEGSAGAEDYMSPFGRAFYLHLAPYFVWRQWMIFLYSSFMVVFTDAYWSVASISSIQIVVIVFTNTPWLGNGYWYDPFILFSLCTAVVSLFITLQSIFALGVVIAAKWILLGRRQPGNYDWDKSSYCQRWQLFLSIERIRRRCLAGHGILGLLTGTAYMTWYFKALGATIGQDCALFVNGEPSLMFTEPDLLELGDRVVVDDASLVGHINTRGKFDLNRLHVGNRCVLRTNSRLLSGARMEDDSCLLENTLIMAGDVVEKGETMQGWPASRFTGKRIPSS